MGVEKEAFGRPVRESKRTEENDQKGPKTEGRGQKRPTPGHTRKQQTESNGKRKKGPRSTG